MEIKIEFRRSNFAQFSEDLWMTCKCGNTSIDFDVYQGEIVEFASHLVDIANDSIRSLNGKDTEDIQERLCELINDINNLA